ncbi:hypothetical protein [Nonomuraea sp. NPDC049141]|uniref:hypothetical protein n=1 Tax=Nonomuraea sp. NPDC049141 TaxID=3155500 RepID=UPI0033CD80E2
MRIPITTAGNSKELMSCRVPCRAVAGTAVRGRAVLGLARFAALDILNQDPDGTFDLVICAETLYYVGRGDRLRLAFWRLRSFMMPGAVLVLVHECRATDRGFSAPFLFRRQD